jgi:hypothetical protein
MRGWNKVFSDSSLLMFLSFFLFFFRKLQEMDSRKRINIKSRKQAITCKKETKELPGQCGGHVRRAAALEDGSPDQSS